jgi:hypothetical protein
MKNIKYHLSFQYPNDFIRGLGVVNTAREAMMLMSNERRVRPHVKLYVKKFDANTGAAVPLDYGFGVKVYGDVYQGGNVARADSA